MYTVECILTENSLDRMYAVVRQYSLVTTYIVVCILIDDMLLCMLLETTVCSAVCMLPDTS